MISFALSDLVEIRPLRRLSGVIEWRGSDGKLYWTAGETRPPEKIVEGQKVPTRAPKGRKRITKESFRRVA